MKKIIILLTLVVLCFSAIGQSTEEILRDLGDSLTDVPNDLYQYGVYDDDNETVFRPASIFLKKTGTLTENSLGVITADGKLESEEDLTYDGTGFLSVDHSSAAGFYGTADGGSNFGGFYAQNNDLIITATDYIAYTSTRHLFGNTGNATTYISVQNAIGSGRVYSFGVFSPVGSSPVFTVDTIGTVTITDTLRINDTNTEIYEDGSNNLVFKDAVTGVKTLAELSAGSNQTLGVSGNNVTLTDGGTADVSSTTAVTTNSAKVTNATHSGEVTGSGVLTIADDIIEAVNLESTNSATDNYLPSYDLASGGFTWVVASGGGDMQAANNLSDLVDDPTSVSNLGFTATVGEINDINDGNTFEQTVTDDATTIPSGAGVVAYISDNTYDVDTTLWLLSDTVIIGSAPERDSFNTTWYYPIFDNSHGSDTVPISNFTIRCKGTTVDFTLDLIKNDTLMGISNDTIVSAWNITDETGALIDASSLSNVNIAPGEIAWWKLSAITTAPDYLLPTVSGYRKNNTY